MDRWCEISLNWFDPSRVDEQTGELLGRLEPLYREVDGIRGLLIDFCIVPDILMMWDGTAKQAIPPISPRISRWKNRTYGDLKNLFQSLREAAGLRGIGDLKVGTLCLAHGTMGNVEIYSVRSPFNELHPEVYGSPGTTLQFHKHLAADNIRYAAFPCGIPAGTTWIEAFAQQWGKTSIGLGLDAILLRDGFFSNHPYSRMGPFGKHASEDPSKNQEITRNVATLFRRVKQANPAAFVMGYSWAATATGEWRVGCSDLEAVVSEGFMDAFIDQTWGGAWQDWWGCEKLGWTMQLSNLLVHGAMIARGNRSRRKPCRFYSLIETWDAWEPWDTLHQVPEKLRWAIWAYTHAAVKTPSGWKVPDGVHLSWINERHEDRIWSAEDVEFLQRNLAAAAASSGGLDYVHGPTLAYNRPFLESVHQTRPAENFSEWTDDQAGILMKYGVPCLSSTPIEWLEPGECDAAILQAPAELDPAVREKLLAGIRRGFPCLVTGRADILDPVILEAAGVVPEGELLASGFQDLDYPGVPGLPEHLQKSHFPEMQPVRATTGRVLAHSRASDFVVASEEGNLIYWQPPDWLFPAQPHFFYCALGSLASHYASARALREASGKAGKIHADAILFEQPVSFHAWRSGGVLHILVGNLETGIAGDSRTPRRIQLVLPKQAGSGVLREIERGEILSPVIESEDFQRFEIPIAPHGSGIYRLEAAPQSIGRT